MGNGGRFPAGCEGKVWDPVSLNVRAVPQVEWADKSPTHRCNDNINDSAVMYKHTNILHFLLNINVLT